MNFFKIGFTILIVVGLLLPQIVLPTVAKAGATLYFSPTSASPKAGESFGVTVYVSTDVSVNTVDTIITFPAGKLKATSTTGGSPFNDFGFAPAIDNANGTVRFLRAAFGGYTGSAGKVGGITFKAIAAGSGSLGFGVSTVGANDGQATNVYSGGGSAGITVKSDGSSSPPPSKSSSPTPPPSTSSPNVQQQTPTYTATPAISSKTHPDQGKWYNHKKIEYSWSDSAEGYNYGIDQAATTQLPAQVKDTTTSASHTVSGDGVWYAHVRAKGANGWSTTAHYKIQIDATAPTDIAVSTQPESPMTVLPTFEMSAKDAISGIDSYKLRIDDGEWREVKNGYKPKQLSSGDHTVTVRAIDKAGNAGESQASFTIVPLAVPDLSSPSSGLIMLGEHFTISGKSLAGITVEIYINGELKETVVADEQGNYSSQEEYTLFPGSYEVAVKAVNKDGITSPLSEPVTVTIDAQAVSVLGMVLPGWGVFGGIGALLAGMVTGIVWLVYKLWRQARLWAGRWRQANKDIEQDLEELEQKLGDRIDAEMAKADPKTAAMMKAVVEEEFDRAEKGIGEALIDAPGQTARLGKPADHSPLGVVQSRLAAVAVMVPGWLSTVVSKVKPVEGKSNSSKAGESKASNAEQDEVVEKRDAEQLASKASSPKADDSGIPEGAQETLDSLASKAAGGEPGGVTDQAPQPAKAMDKIPGVDDILTPDAETSAQKAESEPAAENEAKPAPQPKKVDDIPSDALSALKKLE